MSTQVLRAMFFNVITLALLALALSACGQSTVDASSEKALEDSIVTMAEEGVISARELHQAMATISRDVSEKFMAQVCVSRPCDIRGRQDEIRNALSERIDGMKAEELIAEADRVEAERAARQAELRAQREADFTRKQAMQEAEAERHEERMNNLANKFQERLKARERDSQ